MGSNSTSRHIGAKGESLCTAYLMKIGYKILSRNWFCRWGEIDVIAGDNGKLVFVEVKTVSSGNYFTAKELFHPAKRRKIIRSINIFMMKNSYRVKFWRLDLVCITIDGSKAWIEHYKNVLAL